MLPQYLDVVFKSTQASPFNYFCCNRRTTLIKYVKILNVPLKVPSLPPSMLEITLRWSLRWKVQNMEDSVHIAQLYRLKSRNWPCRDCQFTKKQFLKTSFLFSTGSHVQRGGETACVAVPGIRVYSFGVGEGRRKGWTVDPNCSWGWTHPAHCLQSLAWHCSTSWDLEASFPVSVLTHITVVNLNRDTALDAWVFGEKQNKMLAENWLSNASCLQSQARIHSLPMVCPTVKCSPFQKG